jgi:hypothetical protein
MYIEKLMFFGLLLDKRLKYPSKNGMGPRWKGYVRPTSTQYVNYPPMQWVI